MTWKNLIVQLFVGTEGESGRIGTAYPVAEDTLITAAHVIGDADVSQVEARWWHQKSKADNKAEQWARCTEILWDGRKEGDCDVLVLRCPFPAYASSHWGNVAAVLPRQDAKWSSEGFSFDGERGEEPVPIAGTTHVMGDESSWFACDMTIGRNESTDWIGASGSPVLVDGSIIGVIVTSPKTFDGQRLHAAPLYKLLSDADSRFCRAVNYSPGRDQQGQLRHAAVQGLQNCVEAMQQLSVQFELTARGDKEAWATDLVDCILTKQGQLRDPVQIASLIVKTMNAIPPHSPAADSVRQTLERTAMLLIPASLADSHVHHLKLISMGRDESYLFSATTKALVEFGMSRIHGRDAQFQNDGNQFATLEPLHNIVWPDPGEPDKGGARLKRTFVFNLLTALHLGDMLATSGIDIGQWKDRSGRFADDAVAQEAEDRFVEAINDRLTNLETENSPLKYCVVRYPAAADADDANNLRNWTLNAIRDLDQQHELLTIVGIESGFPSSTELQTNANVRQILCAAAGIQLDK